MAGFAKDRKWTITEKNKSAIKSMEIGDKTEGFVKKRQEMEEGISRIPDDLPQELQQEVDRAIENARKEMEAEGSELANEAKEAQEEADETIENIRDIASDYQKKAQKFSDLSGIPLIGSFSETKASELNDQVEQLTDLAQETQKYSDSLAASRNRILNK